MPLRATVVLTSFTTTHRATLESIDRQSLRASEFEVLVVEDGTDAGTVEQLDQLVANRPNVTHLRVDRGTGRGARRNAGRSAARGDYVLVLDDGMVLAEEALARLCAYAAEACADICLGRTSRPGEHEVPSRLFDENLPQAKQAEAAEAFDAARVYRRGFLDEAGLRFSEPSEAVHDLGFDLAALSRTDAVAVLADYPAMHWADPFQPSLAGELARSAAAASAPDDVRQGALLSLHRRCITHLLESPQDPDDLATYRRAVADVVPAGLDHELPARHRSAATALRAGDHDALARVAAERSGRLVASDVSAEWRDGLLHLAMDLAPRTAAGSPAEPGVSVRRPLDGQEWQVRGEGVRLTDAGAEEDAMRLTAVLDPARLAGGGRLATGVWQVDVLASVDQEKYRLRVPLGRKVPTRMAFLDRVPVVCFSDEGTLALDVGALTKPAVSRLDAAQASIVENVHGTLLRVALPLVDLPSGSEVVGRLRIGWLPVHARITAKDGLAQLSATVSGPTGTYPLATRFSEAPFARSGIALDVDAVGRMSVRPARAARTQPARQSKHATGWLRRVVRRIPGSQGAYRKLRGTGGS